MLYRVYEFRLQVSGLRFRAYCVGLGLGLHLINHGLVMVYYTPKIPAARNKTSPYSGSISQS